jgi:hypothetical protein
MFKNKIDEFLIVYEEHKQQRQAIPTKEDVLLESMKVFVDSKTKRDKKRSAKLLLKIKPSMKDHKLWEFIDEDMLLVVSKS